LDCVEQSVNGGTCFIIRPNASLSWRGSLFCYGLIVTVSLTIALGFAAIGLWPVLPFAGAELLLLGAAMYHVALRCREREIIRIAAGKVEVLRGRRRLVREAEFHLPWVRVVLQSTAASLAPLRVLLRGQGRETEVGRFLVEAERRRLARRLAHSIGSA